MVLKRVALLGERVVPIRLCIAFMLTGFAFLQHDIPVNLSVELNSV
jgi:hypothetical protein